MHALPRGGMDDIYARACELASVSDREPEDGEHVIAREARVVFRPASTRERSTDIAVERSRVTIREHPVVGFNLAALGISPEALGCASKSIRGRRAPCAVALVCRPRSQDRPLIV